MKNNPIRIRARPDRLCRRGHHGFYFDLLGIFLCLTQAIALVGKERDSFPDWKLKGTLAGLADSNPSVRALAAEALGEGGTTVLPRIADVMKHDGDELVRAAAAKALATARAYGYTDDIAVMVDDPNWEVKVAAAEALGVLHNQPPFRFRHSGNYYLTKKIRATLSRQLLNRYLNSARLC